MGELNIFIFAVNFVNEKNNFIHHKKNAYIYKRTFIFHQFNIQIVLLIYICYTLYDVGDILYLFIYLLKNIQTFSLLKFNKKILPSLRPE